MAEAATQKMFLFRAMAPTGAKKLGMRAALDESGLSGRRRCAALSP